MSQRTTVLLNPSTQRILRCENATLIMLQDDQGNWYFQGTPLMESLQVVNASSGFRSISEQDKAYGILLDNTRPGSPKLYLTLFGVLSAVYRRIKDPNHPVHRILMEQLLPMLLHEPAPVVQPPAPATSPEPAEPTTEKAPEAPTTTNTETPAQTLRRLADEWETTHQDQLQALQQRAAQAEKQAESLRQGIANLIKSVEREA